MGEISTKHIENAYGAAGDGLMRGCVKGACPDSCCQQRVLRAGPDGVVTCQTLLWDEAEARYQQALSPSLTDLGISLCDVPANGSRSPGNRGTQKRIYALDGCQGSDDSCKLLDRGRKPLLCRTFPFSMDEQHPLFVACPSVVEICRDPIVMERMVAVREALGFHDHGGWRFNVAATADLVERSRDLPIVWGARDYK